MDNNKTFTLVLTAKQANELYKYLNENNFELSERQYTKYFASKPGLSVILYNNLKLVVQGKDAREFMEFVVEPLILQKATIGYEKVLNPDYYLPRIGVDESGKGDYFGPLCIAGVYVNEKVIKLWESEAVGVRDSKQITSDSSLKKIALIIKKTPGCVATVVPIGNEAYNRLYDKLGNVNKILAWGHSRVIENLMEKNNDLNPVPQLVICDQFANRKEVIQNSLMSLGRQIKIVQKHKAESDIAVAAASIMARYEFITRLDKMKNEYGVDFPRGCSDRVQTIASEFVKKFGAEMLKKVAKLHFKTTNKVLGDEGNP
jgi:ribonuclease HIII